MTNRLKPGYNFFDGVNICGTRVAVAVRADGAYFYRFYRFNGYGMAWSKWTKTTGPMEVVENYLGERPGLVWGFTTLVGSDLKETTFRLPKN
jgi:hypothetical protein